MCIAAGTAAAAALSTTSTIVGMASTAFGIIQSQQQAQYQAAAAAQQMDLQYQQAQQSAFRDRQQQVQQFVGQVEAQQQGVKQYQKQLNSNNQALNKSYASEQAKLQEARSAAAFKAQANYAKAIGTKGTVLAAGQTGQSVGLLAMDADRQAGLATAQQNASLRGAEIQAGIGMDVAFDQAQTANNQAFSKVGLPVQHPTLAPDPIGIGKNLNLGIPSYGSLNG
jgi:hypothetical protein